MADDQAVEPHRDSAWVDRALGVPPDPAGRIVGVATSEEEIDGTIVGVVELAFTAEDLRGQSYQARGRVLLPESLRDRPDALCPVWFACGYQLPDATLVAEARRGRVVVNPLDPEPGEVHAHTNPLGRGPNTDIVLDHLVRGLRFVDPTRVVYAGGSAGGYAALLVAAQAFPAVAAVTTSPVLNLPYQSAYFADMVPRVLAPPPPDQPLLPLLLGAMNEISEATRTAYGEVAAPALWDHSPLAHLDRITCPVVAVVSTADFLVPLVQVDRDLAAATLDDLPGEVRMAPEDLTDVPAAHRQLLSELSGRADVRTVPVPEGAAEIQLADLDLTLSTPATPVQLPAWPGDDDTPRWLIAVIDEGPTVFGATHGRHQLQPDTEPLVASLLATEEPISVDQLTEPKFGQLLARHRGEEWLAPGFTHLDHPAAERADVERSLLAFSQLSPRHAERVVELYGALDDDHRTLPLRLVEQIRTAAG